MSKVTSQPVLNRIAAIFLIAALAPVASLGAVCAGWSASASARMACCHHPHATCASVSADECCADGEQRQNVESLAPVLIAALPTVMPQPHLFAAPLVRLVADDPFTYSERPHPRLLGSVFRI